MDIQEKKKTHGADGAVAPIWGNVSAGVEKRPRAVEWAMAFGGSDCRGFPGRRGFWRPCQIIFQVHVDRRSFCKLGPKESLLRELRQRRRLT